MRHLKLAKREISFFSTVYFYSALFLTCCSSSHLETDAGSTDEESIEGDRCEVTRELFAVEDITPLGYSAQDVIDMLWGTWQCDDLEWGDLPSVGVLYPDEKPNKITVTQSYEGGDIIFEHSVRVGDTDFDLSCSSQLVIPTVLTLESTDGFFSETLKGVARIVDRPLSSSVGFGENPSKKFSGLYNFVPNENLQALPDTGTFFSFGSRVHNKTEAGAQGYIFEYFWSDQTLVETDPPTFDSWGASITTLSFYCQIRNIDTVVSEENGQ